MEILSFMIMVAWSLVPCIIANDSINVSQFMSDGKTLVSKGGKFELGFFSPGSSQKRYLGIWYKNIPMQTVVWVANRENPINDSSGILTVNSTGNLVLTQNGSLVWYTNSHKQAQNPVVELLDSGNLVIGNEGDTDTEGYLWQSFDYPSDTLLPGMKLGSDLRTGLQRKYIAWKSTDDPSPGDVYRVLKLYNYPEFYLMNGTKKLFRYGPWNGQCFSGMTDLLNNTYIFGLNFGLNFVSNKDEIYTTFSLVSDYVITRTVTNQSGSISRYVWAVGEDQDWKVYRSHPKEDCDTYGLCGPNGYCVSTQSQACQCLKGFGPKSPKKWNSADWSQGCVRNKPLRCKDKLTEGFVKFKGLKVPDTTHTWLDESIGLEECRVKCLNDCSCMAFTNSDIRGRGNGCVMWFGDLIDLKQFETGGQDLYIRMDASELEHGHKKNTIVAATVAAICGVLMLSTYFICRIRRNNAEKEKSEKDDIDLPTFDFPFISNATNRFSQNNKLGQGGFGTVYKGILPDGQEVAVKRLCKTSRQDPTKRALLGWTKRFEIIGGIARGLLYLHQDSRLKIIHRDLKASNILLDSDMNSKISDFGMARIFALDQDEADTNRVMGTYGYIPPEYAVHGSFSIKSDVFSFGVIILEIISGRKNRGFCDPDRSLNLLGHAWRLWIESRPMELVDELVEDSTTQYEIIRNIHIGLLCVQQRPQDRPNMSSILLMLNGEKLLPEPSQPGFYTGKDNSTMIDTSLRNTDSYSLNEMSNSLLEAR
ncbi:G-type lectin S-receptor-like serine/threonine-protein kinase At4g27290 isoform X2 [Cajanus cajan]|uniref:G-type lectin S-receptor-like serine/threonine-protein kinase At4g27290 isoform X2 n=1 Tax=Cajanus cajan TaxID=3821 RepID=UPI0010FB0C90|nr:G-type lectin S-receptor-like serine/threonine-protein kinase At4g27290 isoform X2 [Cajanus cajan]